MMLDPTFTVMLDNVLRNVAVTSIASNTDAAITVVTQMKSGFIREKETFVANLHVSLYVH